MEKEKGNMLYSIGFLVGESIIHKLPRLGWGDCMATEEESEEEDRLSDVWRESEKGSLEYIISWNKLLTFRANLKITHLPSEIEFNVSNTYLPEDEEGMKILKKGLYSSLWNSDICEYSLRYEDMVFSKVRNEYCGYTFLKLILRNEIPLMPETIEQSILSFSTSNIVSKMFSIKNREEAVEFIRKAIEEREGVTSVRIDETNNPQSKIEEKVISVTINFKEVDGSNKIMELGFSYNKKSGNWRKKFKL